MPLVLRKNKVRLYGTLAMKSGENGRACDASVSEADVGKSEQPQAVQEVDPAGQDRDSQ